ncbi:YD repeat-containing protein [Burkholderia sp. GAS332]|uniref:colicin E5-related ribonuclease n=1 Tax=Paraburkholderia sediminicola TaxID=458836 RepID=UPI00092C3AAD|nr:YD repeat-containing protein [Burkholderia sp. GAS332]
MKSRNPSRGAVVNLGRLLAAFALLLVAFGARADYTSDCTSRYAKSGAIQGTKSCALTVASNSPGGPGGYSCLNDIDLIKQWCAGTDPQPNAEPEQSCPVADPVYPGSGAVTLTESDFVSGDDIPVVFTRTYRSTPLAKNIGAMGPVWFHSWQRQLDLTNANSGSSSKILAYRANGEPLTFNWSGGFWRTATYSGLVLSQSGMNWTLSDPTTGIVESYSLQGVLLSERTRTGFTRTLTYDSTGLLTAITQHADGTRAGADLTLRFDYDDKRRLSRLNDPLSGMTQYAYDANSNLVSVTWPDGNMRRYVYDDTRFRNAITGEIDETGTRIATWTYDAQGRATAVSHPDTARNVQFGYGSGKTTVTDSQRTTTVNFSSIGGVLRPTGTSSAARTTSTTWDASGNLLKDTNPTGGTNEYSYDEAGRAVRLVVRNASSTTVTSVRYVDATSLIPSMIASPRKVRAFVYDGQGNVTGFSEFATNDPTGESAFDAKASGQQRTVGVSYDSSSRVVAALEYFNGSKTADWLYFYDETGNLRLATDRVSGWTLGMMGRDAAHRATHLVGDNREALITYNARGRVTQFVYYEYPTALNGSLHRILTVKYGYSADGRIVSRTGTVAKNNGGSTFIGAATPITSDEIDQWLNNLESGVNPAGPPANRVGWVRSMLGALPEAGLQPICIECMFNPALGWAWAISSDNDDPFGIVGIAGTIRTGVDAISKLCKPTANQISSVYEDKIVGQMKKRGWTQEDVEATIAHPSRTIPTRDNRFIPNGNGARRDDPATAYIRDDGHYVVRNDVDGKIVQVSDRYDTGWKSKF